LASDVDGITGSNTQGSLLHSLTCVAAMSTGVDIQELRHQFEIKNFEATCSIKTVSAKDRSKCGMQLPALFATDGQEFYINLTWKGKADGKHIPRPDDDSWLGMKFAAQKRSGPMTYGRLFVEIVNADCALNIKRCFEAFVALDGSETGWTHEHQESSQGVGLQLKTVFDASKGWLQNGALRIDVKLHAVMDDQLTSVDILPPLNTQKEVCKNWEAALKSGEHTDVVIKVNGQDLRAHSLVLRTQSTVFAATLNSSMRESNERAIYIEGLDVEAVRITLMFLYSGEVDEEYLKVDEHALGVLEAAHRYNIPALEQICVRSLSGRFNVNNVAEWFYIADLIGHSDFRSRCLNFIRGRIAEVQGTESYAKYIDRRPALLSEILRSIFPPVKRARTESADTSRDST